MSTDRTFQRAVEAGQRNADGFKLVKNWCAHVRIERMGGGGMVEAMTGLPIGHHGLACDYAPAGGMMCWDTRDAALDFFDRNCVGCSHHKPVGAPNLSIWVAERDRALAERRVAEEAAALERETQLAARRGERQALRAGLPPAAADIVDQIEELDVERANGFSSRLVETAKLAPEAFAPQVVEYAFRVIEARERWFDEPGLAALAVVNAEPARLARCAMLALRDRSATITATKVLMARLSAADPSLVAAILPTLIDLACPSRGPFERYRRSRRAPLALIGEAYPTETAAALDALLERGPTEIGRAAQALEILVRRTPALATRFARDLVSKLVRAKWMPDPGDYGHDVEDSASHEVREAVVAMFARAPEQMDGLLKSFRAGASEAGGARIVSIYSRVLHFGRFRRDRPISAADRLAFQRLLWEATQNQSDKVLQEIQGVIHDDPRELIDLARDQVDQLIGAAILMDERIRAFDAELPVKNPTMLDVMERSNRRQTLSNLRRCFTSWAAAGAAAAGAPRAYLDVLDNLPEKQDSFAACMIEHSVHLADCADGLNAVLPSLYSALVGASVLRRGAAARAFGKIPSKQRRNAPDLLFEAFLTALTDPYVYVHRSAVAAMGRFHLPDKFRDRVRQGLWGVLVAHHRDADSQDLVLEIIEQVDGLLNEEEKAGRPGAFLVSLMAKMPAWRLSGEIRWISRELARAEGMMDLLIALLTNPEATEHCEEHALESIADLPSDVVYAHRAKLAAVSIGQGWPGRFRVLHLVEVLTRCGAWNEAEEMMAAAVAAVPDTVGEASVRLSFQLTHAAAAFENAVARGDSERAAAMAARWREVKQAKEANDRAIAQRPDPFRDLRQSAGGG